jgi:cobalt-zinc-cadmium efflux system membrane fusion protein
MTSRIGRPMILVGLMFAIACGKQVPPSRSPAETKPAREDKNPRTQVSDGHESAKLAGGHSDGEGDQVSDLDRPVEELFGAGCEHGVKTFECDECRYEMGVVKVAPCLVEGGLIRIAQAVMRTVEAPLALTGEVRFDERRVTHLAPRTDGVIRAVHVQLGDRVKGGQALIEVDSIVLGDAQGEYLVARASLELAARTLERQQALRREGVSSQREALEAGQAFEAADIRVRAASERLLRLGLDTSDLKSLGGASRLGSARGRLVVRAPIDGRVVEMHAVAGEAAKAGESTMVIGETDPVWVLADLYEDNLGTVQDRLGKGPVAAVVTVKAFPDQEFLGTLDLLGSVMDRESRTVKARVSAANPDGKLRPGMFANVKLGLPGDDVVLAIPRPALMIDEGRSFVFVPHHGDFWVRRPVRVGREWDGWVEIKGGIQAGQKVAADGAFLLKSDVLRSKMGAGCAD